MISASFNTISLNYIANSCALFDNFADKKYAIFLDSCSDRRKDSGVDVITSSPYLIFTAYNDEYQIFDSQQRLLEKGTLALARLLKLQTQEFGSLLGY